jgi:hypothetical protein
MFYDIKETLSYNALFNFIVGNRGSGKSYGAKKWCISDFLNNGSQFVWVRRFDSELDDFKTAFFSDIKNEFPNAVFDYKSYKFYVDREGAGKEKEDLEFEVMGYAISLSISAKKKSSSYPMVNKIIYDEFIIDKGSSYYLKKEVEVFLDLYETVMRMRENVKGAFFLANAITFTNPYFLYFNVNKPLNKKGILKTGEILIQLVNNADFIDKKKNTRFGKLITGTDYGDFSIENTFLRDTNDFIVDEKPKELRYFFTIKSESEFYGVWISDIEGKMYVTRKYDPSYKLVYTTMLENHKPNTMLLKGASKSVIFSTFIKAFKMGNVCFDSIKTKNVVIETIKNTL